MSHEVQPRSGIIPESGRSHGMVAKPAREGPRRRGRLLPRGAHAYIYIYIERERDTDR